MIGRDWISAALCLLRYLLGGKTNISQFVVRAHAQLFFVLVSNAARESNTQKIKIYIEIHDKHMASNRATVSPASSCDFGQECGGLGEGDGGRVGAVGG